MQTKKLSFARIIAMALCAIVFAAAFTIPLATQQKSAESVSAAGAAKTVTVTFSGFPTNVVPYVVVRFSYLETVGDKETTNVISKVITSNTETSMNIGNVAGKLEINYPLYSTISNFVGTGLTKTTTGSSANSFVTYDGTLTSNINFTVTFNDNGYFAGTTIY